MQTNTHHREEKKIITRNNEPCLPLYWWDHVSKHWWDSPSLCWETTAGAKTSVRWKRHSRHTSYQPEHQQFGSNRTWIWIKVQKTNDGTRRITRRHLMNPKATTQHCCSWEQQNDECWRIADHTPSSAPCSHDSKTSCNNGQSIIVPHQLHPNTTRSTMLHNKLSHLRNHTRWEHVKLGMELHT